MVHTIWIVQLTLFQSTTDCFSTTAARQCSSKSLAAPLTQQYDDLVAKEYLQRDSNQLRVVSHLEELRKNLSTYQPSVSEPTLFQQVCTSVPVTCTCLCKYNCAFLNVRSLVGDLKLTNQKRLKESTSMDLLV